MYSGYFEHTEIGIILFDENRVIIDVNPTFLKFCEVDRSTALGKNITELFDKYPFYDNYVNWLGSYETNPLRISLQNKKKLLRQIALSKGGIIEVIDISELIQVMEKDQLQYNTDLLTLLTKGISHDFNNHLMAISGSLNLLILDSIDLSPAQRKYLYDAQKALFQATGLVKQFQHLSRDEPSVELKIDFYSIIRNTFSFLDRTSSKVVDKRINFIQDIFFITADPVKLNHAFLNIISAMISAVNEQISSESPYLQVSAMVAEKMFVSQSLGSEESYLLITIEDNFSKFGAGLNDLAFIPKAESQQELEKIEHLGLRIAYDYVTKQKLGKMSIKEDVDKTIVKILLPGFIQGEEVERIEIDEKLPTGNETILIADDEEVVLNVLTMSLKQLGYKVHCVRDGLQAVDFYHELAEEIDLILLDITMPKLSGTEVMIKIKEIDPDAKIIISSGHTEEETHRGILDTADGHLNKPYNRNDLARLVRKVLDN